MPTAWKEADFLGTTNCCRALVTGFPVWLNKAVVTASRSAWFHEYCGMRALGFTKAGSFSLVWRYEIRLCGAFDLPKSRSDVFFAPMVVRSGPKSFCGGFPCSEWQVAQPFSRKILFPLLTASSDGTPSCGTVLNKAESVSLF